MRHGGSSRSPGSREWTPQGSGSETQPPPGPAAQPPRGRRTSKEGDHHYLSILWATGIKETLARRTHGITVSASGTRLRYTYSSFAPESAESFRAEVTAATAANVPDLALSARRTARCKPFSRAARAQESSVGIADRWLATWRVQIQAVRAAVARSVSPRCAAVPTDASMSARSALKATSEVGTGGPATRVIERPMSYRPVPAMGTHAGRSGGYRLTRLYKVNNRRRTIGATSQNTNRRVSKNPY